MSLPNSVVSRRTTTRYLARLLSSQFNGRYKKAAALRRRSGKRKSPGAPGIGRYRGCSTVSPADAAAPETVSRTPSITLAPTERRLSPAISAERCKPLAAPAAVALAAAGKQSGSGSDFAPVGKHPCDAHADQSSRYRIFLDGVLQAADEIGRSRALP